MASQVPFLRFAAEVYLGHPFFVVWGCLLKDKCRSLGSLRSLGMTELRDYRTGD